MNTINFDQVTNPAKLKGEIRQVVLGFKQKSKEEAFSFALSQISDEMLSKMLQSVGGKSNDDPSASLMLVQLAAFLRQHLHGNENGRAALPENEFFDIINTVAPYMTVELVRRRGCFGFLELPSSPWAFNATVRIREPHRVAIERTITELETLKVPVFPLLTDEEDLQRMERENLGVVVPMGVKGRSIATEEMLQIQPQKAPALDPQAFIEAFQDVNDRALSREPMPRFELPSSLPSEVDLMDKEGGTRRINIPAMQNSPEGRMISILHEHFGHDYEENRSAILRFYALVKLLRDGTLSRWAPENAEGASLHPAVLVAASTMKLTKGGDFPPAKFQQEVQRLVAEDAKA